MATKASSTDTESAEELSAYSKAKRDQIIRGALEVFLQYGYEGTSMNRVAERACVIKQTIYSHFKDKEGLFRAIIQSLTLQNFHREFGEKIPIDEKPERVLRRLAQIFSARQRDPSYINLMRTVIGESSRFPELARLYTNTVIKPGMNYLVEYFRAQPDLNIADPEATARIFCGTIVNHIMCQEILLGKEIIPMQLERVTDALIEMIIK